MEGHARRPALTNRVSRAVICSFQRIRTLSLYRSMRITKTMLPRILPLRSSLNHWAALHSRDSELVPRDSRLLGHLVIRQQSSSYFAILSKVTPARANQFSNELAYDSSVIVLLHSDLDNRKAD
jgi:hypothetical protein